jgi:hypothetical protein
MLVQMKSAKRRAKLVLLCLAIVFYILHRTLNKLGASQRSPSSMMESATMTTLAPQITQSNISFPLSFVDEHCHAVNTWSSHCSPAQPCVLLHIGMTVHPRSFSPFETHLVNFPQSLKAFKVILVLVAKIRQSQWPSSRKFSLTLFG